MRPGRFEDLPQLLELSRNEVAIGRQDAAPDETRLRRTLARFDWDVRSRVIDRDGALKAFVMVTARPTPEGLIAQLYAGANDDSFEQVVAWGVQFARASGAEIVQTRVAKGFGAPLARAGLRMARPWWRMDRSLADALADVVGVDGYELVDGRALAAGAWGETFTGSFADHWRFIPQSGEELLAGKALELCLAAINAAGRKPVAITLSEVETDPHDTRPQPVGIVSSVGTVPAHRRRGLAGWLVAESLRRLRDCGARSASLYVDALNPQHAYEVYRKLGFEVVHEAEVWEATFP